MTAFTIYFLNSTSNLFKFHGLVVRIVDCHPGGRGSNPDQGIIFFYSFFPFLGFFEAVGTMTDLIVD